MAELFDKTNQPQITEIPENVKLDDLVGEGKKYKTTEDAAKALLHKDLHISRIETENQVMRDELKVRTTLEEFYDKVNKPQSSELENRNTNSEEEKEKGTLTTEQLEALISKTLDERVSKSKADQNIKLVQEKLQEVFGAHWQSELQTRTAKLGLGKEFVTTLAQEQPGAVLKLLDIPLVKEDTDAPTLFNRVTSVTPGNPQRKNAYYRKMMRENPKEYWKRETQEEIFRQVEALGDAFYA